MESLQLPLLLSCKPCPKLPKHGSNLGFRPFTQVGFGSLWRNHARSACLLARSSVNSSGGGGGSGTHDSFGNDSERKRFNLISSSDMISYEEIGEPEPLDSHINYENLEDEKYGLLENQLKEIQVELRKNNEEIKNLRETANRLWGRLRTEVFATIRMQHLIDKNGEHETAIGTEQMSQLPPAPEPRTTPEGRKKRKQGPSSTIFGGFKKPRH